MDRTIMGSDTELCEVYPDLSTALDYARRPPSPCMQEFHARVIDSASVGHEGFGVPGAKTGNEVLRYLIEGKVDAFITGMQSKTKWLQRRLEGQGEAKQLEVPRRVRTRAAMGDTLDIHAARAGRHETAWETTRRAPMPAIRPRLATVVIAPGVSWNVAPDAALWRSAAAFVVCDYLQKQRVAVEVVVDTCSGAALADGPREYSIVARIKDYLQVTSPEALAAGGSAAFYRSLVFALKFQNSRACRPASSLGFPMDKDSMYVRQRREAGSLIVKIPNTALDEDRAATAVDAAIKAYNDYRPGV
jgi:hypothetical protein